MSITERQAIKIILNTIQKDSTVLLPYGDDASAIPVQAGAAVLKADMFVRATDAPRGMTLRQMAMKAITASISDLAAKGAKPLALLLSLALPPETTSEHIKELALGFKKAAKLYGASILGGDINEGPDIIIDCLAFSQTDSNNLIPRSGAKPGDIIATTGHYGDTLAALKLTEEEVSMSLPNSMREKLLNTLFEPRAHLKEGLALAGIASASIDSSDGLAWSIYEMTKMSCVKAVITDVPISHEAAQFAEKAGIPPTELALYGGEEYSIVATINPEKWTEAINAIRKVGGQLQRIGYISKGKDVYLKEEDETLNKIEMRGWEHLKGKNINLRLN